MAKPKKPSVSPIRKEFLRAQTHIKRLGYEAPATPQCVTKKALVNINQQEQTAIESHKAYSAAKQRQRYWGKRGLDVSGIQIERGKSREEYAKFTRSYFTSYSQEQVKSRHPESIQPYENRYQSSIETILRVDNVLQEFTGFAPRGPNDVAWADRKNRMYLVVKSYWTDAVDMSDMQDVTRFAAALEGRAETLFDLVDSKMRMSNTPEEDRAYLSTAIEIITGAKLARTDSDIINEAIDDYMFY